MLSAWLNGTNPVVDLALSEAGELTFANAATRAAVAKPAEKYTVRWARFDNATATAHPVGDEQTVREPKAAAPAELLAGKPDYISVEVRAFHPDQPAWSQPLSAYFRRTGDRWTLVGLDRIP